MNVPFPIRKECPPGACTCERERLLANPAADLRILRLTLDEEKKLLARIERITTFADLKDIERRLHAQLGIVLRMAPGIHEVRTARGISLEIDALPGLCRKTRKAIPAAIRRCFEAHPEIVFELLDSHDLFGER